MTKFVETARKGTALSATVFALTLAGFTAVLAAGCGDQGPPEATAPDMAQQKSDGGGPRLCNIALGVGCGEMQICCPQGFCALIGQCPAVVVDGGADDLSEAPDLKPADDMTMVNGGDLAKAPTDDGGMTPPADLAEKFDLVILSDLSKPADDMTMVNGGDLAKAPTDDGGMTPPADLTEKFDLVILSDLSKADLAVAPACQDGKKNADETDVDCGGSCPAKCPDKKGCLHAADCQSGVCTNNICTSAKCSDGVKNGVETDTDCGGSCPAKCDNGNGCKVGADCSSFVCTSSQCVAASCGDKVKNGKESDTDCGGPDCNGCANTKACQSGGDCLSKSCVGGKCAAPTCLDGVKNGQETGLDCGGLCPACPNGQGCTVNSDCASKICKLQTCIASSCGDGVKNGKESDTDCGGASQSYDQNYGNIACSRCATEKACKWDGDCLSWYCRNGVCRDASCVDGIMNNGETGEDCGGPCTVKCPDGDYCFVNKDCSSGFCMLSNLHYYGKCAPRLDCKGQTQCGNGCTNTTTDVKNCGTCGNMCANGETCVAGVCQNPIFVEVELTCTDLICEVHFYHADKQNLQGQDDYGVTMGPNTTVVFPLTQIQACSWDPRVNARVWTCPDGGNCYASTFYGCGGPGLAKITVKNKTAGKVVQCVPKQEPQACGGGGEGNLFCAKALFGC